ncbi:hypothetical protein [Caldimonas tepidiphila]|uniref:hypothetical protein n=1 Tax=Caldimonas tepidiphila TaxID=2315841 RepID=UPI000E5A58EA|nr:hypothetical protein [Caldimonas tepidiphila]
MRMLDWGLVGVAVLLFGMTEVQGENKFGAAVLGLTQPEEPLRSSAAGPAAFPPAAGLSMRPAKAYRPVERGREGRSPQEERRR